jgi:hypothetical protein
MHKKLGLAHIEKIKLEHVSHVIHYRTASVHAKL